MIVGLVADSGARGVSQAAYRIGQVVDWVRALGTRPDASVVRYVLPLPLQSLFHRMPVVDQRHGLRMLDAVVLALADHEPPATPESPVIAKSRATAESPEAIELPVTAESPPESGLQEPSDRVPRAELGHALPAALVERYVVTDAPVVQAALLHDVGKAEAGVGLIHRVLRVLMKGRLAGVWTWLSDTPTGWKRPFWVMAHHPERGAVWVESEGGSPELCRLIRYHEADPPTEWSAQLRHWHAVLSAADARN